MRLKRFSWIVIWACLASPLAEAKDLSPKHALCSQLLRYFEAPPKTSDPFLNAFQEDPIAMFQRLRKRALEAASRGERDFSFIEMKPTLHSMLKEIHERLGSIRTHADDRAVFEGLGKDGETLLADGIPYKRFTRFSVDFIKAIDKAYRRAHPQYKTYYHETLASPIIDKILDRSPYTFAYPSFSAVDSLYFLWTRIAPLHLQGVTMEAVYGDGFWLTPSEFEFHDWGHTEFFSIRDIDMLTDPYESIDATLLEWKKNRDRILGRIRSVVPIDPDLAEAALLILFEVIHERGYPYDLFRLRPQFETRKWIEIIERKVENRFWGSIEPTEAQMARLEEARTWLRDSVGDFIREDARDRLDRVASGSLGAGRSVRVKVTAKNESYEGALKRVHLRNDGTAWPVFDVSGRDVSTFIMDASLAQISDAGAPEFSSEVVRKLQDLIWVSYKASRVERIGDPAIYRVSDLWIDSKGGIFVELNGKVTAPLDQVRIPYAVEGNPVELDRIVLYKIRQLQAQAKRNVPVTFTQQPPPVLVEGAYLRIEGLEGQDPQIVLQSGPDLVRIPLSDARIYTDGPIVFGVRGAEDELSRYASRHGLLPGKSWTKGFSNRMGVEVHLTTSVAYREVTVFLPRVLSPTQLMEALAHARTAKTLGASRIVVASEGALKDVKVLDSGGQEIELPLERLFGLSGASRARESFDSIRKIDLGALPETGVSPAAEAVVLDSSYPAMSDALAHHAGLKQWSDPRSLPKGQAVYLVASMGKDTDEHLLSALSQIWRLRKNGSEAHLVSPYLPYARADKVDYPGETMSMAKLVADLIEGLGAQSMLFVHAHASQTQSFYNIRTENLSGRATLTPVIQAERADQLLSPDEGASKDNNRYAKDLGIGSNMLRKIRDLKTGETRVGGIQDPNVQDLVVFSLDDELDTGGTSGAGADLMKSLRAKRYVVGAVHLTGAASKALENANVDEVVVTDTVPIEIRHPKLRVIPVAPEIAERIKAWERDRRSAAR